MNLSEKERVQTQEAQNWAIAKASVRGTSHLADGKPCQDFSLLKWIDGGFIAAVSDGAGSAAHSERGARLVCFSFVQFFLGKIREGERSPSWSSGEVEEWHQQFTGDVAAYATRKNWKVRDLACTFLGVILIGTRAFCVHIGDGGIVIGRADEGNAIEYECAFWPENGEYANLTNFVTQEDAMKYFQSGEFENVLELAMFSDGIQRLVLDSATKTPHEPFFEAMIAPLRREAKGESITLNKSLERFLSSKEINDRTDDDKTLLIVTSIRNEKNDLRQEIIGPTEEESGKKIPPPEMNPESAAIPKGLEDLAVVQMKEESNYVDSLEKYEFEPPLNPALLDEDRKLKIISEPDKV